MIRKESRKAKVHMATISLRAHHGVHHGIRKEAKEKEKDPVRTLCVTSVVVEDTLREIARTRLRVQVLRTTIILDW